jgi:DNA segregation ATPase FtsK/SpoIIIE-like protein
LQSLVASLAVANRPDAMTFVLVDYKGGAAFRDCVNLPHTVGMVTDLDTHLVERALTSLGAELTHCEHQLADAGAKDLEDYLDYATRRPGLAPIPRLLIVIDEFASMARELPDFVTGLVNVAQRGRSLGIHLILATQRPSGVVSAEIRANTNLRVALRMTDAGESTDVIDARDAAGIPAGHPGRGFRAPSGVETQIALVAANPQGPVQVAALRTLGERLTEREAAVPKAKRPADAGGAGRGGPVRHPRRVPAAAAGATPGRAAGRRPRVRRGQGPAARPR